MAIEEQQTELSWEEAVSRFLRENPDYFDRNPHLLHHLDIPHPDTGQAVSLIERQVAALRRNNQALESQLGQLIDNATENDALAGQLHRFTVDLMQANSINEVIDLVDERVKTLFNLDLVLLKLFAAGEGGDEAIQKLCDQMKTGESVCGIYFSEEEAQHLFGEDHSFKGSYALIPVQHKTLSGLLVIGSDDESRFVVDMATTYLDRLGELIGVAISRLSDTR